MEPPMALHFDEWIRDEFGKGPFTALIMLVEIGEETVEPVASTYLHVIGDDIDWFAMKEMLDRAPHVWQGVAFFPERLSDTGPISNELARLRLNDLKEQVTADRLTLNGGAFFDGLGRKIKVEAAEDENPLLH
jgi:hypothetical protein